MERKYVVKYSIIAIVMVFAILIAGVNVVVGYQSKEKIIEKILSERKDVEMEYFLCLEVEETKSILLLGKIKDSEEYTYGYGYGFLLPKIYRFYDTEDVSRLYLVNHKSTRLLGNAEAMIIEKDEELFLQTAEGELIPFEKIEIEK
ncbi:MAG: hypothetical protein Q4A29_04745 [Eubacteriales bacterium]|nr:hypothetical protein [Eubacteriales bacterium]